MSRIYNFGWHEWVCYRDHGSFPGNKEKIRRILGPCKNEGNEMSQSIVASRDHSTTRRTVLFLRASENHSKTEKRKRKIFDDIILQRLGDSVVKPTKPDAPNHVTYSDGLDPCSVKFLDDNDPSMPDSTAVFDKPITDQWIYAELNMAQGQSLRKVKVFSQFKHRNDDLKGSYETSPFLNTLTCGVEFADDEIKDHSTNFSAENAHAQADDDGHAMQILDAIVDFRKDRNGVDKASMNLFTKSGQQCLRHVFSGWSVLILRKNGEEELIPPNRLKQSLLLETSKFTVARVINNTPSSKWWASCAISRRDSIVAGVNKRVRRVTHKHGVELPTSVAQAKKSEYKSDDTVCVDAMYMEIEKLKVSFFVLEDGAKSTVGCNKASSHLVFDSRMTFELKSRRVKDWNRNPEPEWSTFSGV